MTENEVRSILLLCLTCELIFDGLALILCYCP